MSSKIYESESFMKNKKLFGMVTSWLLVILMLAGCIIAPQNATSVPSLPDTPAISAPATSAPASQPGSVVTPPDTESTVPPSAPATQPGTEASVPGTESTTPPTTPATQPSTTAPTTTPPVTTPPVTTPPVTIPPESKPSESPVPEGSSFAVHFIDVGQADAALVLCDGKAMLIDGGNKADSNLIYTYLKKHNITHLDYIIGTHGHEDHIGGIPGALQFATAGVVYCSVTSYNSKAFDNFKNAVKNRGLSITVPTVGTTFNLGSATCTILAVNTPDAKGNKPDANNSSIVMRIVYGNTSFLFTGDAEEQVEKAILNSGANIKSDVLKVGHHGSDTSTGYLWLRTIDPQYAVIPVGSGNPYNHPTEAVLSRLRDADVTTFRTDKQGDILCVSDGTNLTFTPSRNANINVYEKIGPNSTQS
jgi:competence protein ComEC